MILKIKKLTSNAVIPARAKQGDAGMDLTVTSIKKKSLFKIQYGFGLAMEFEDSYVARIVPRSSIHKTFMILSNSEGVCDSSYRGEYMAVFYKIPFLSKPYRIGERAVQLLIQPVPEVNIEEVNNLSETDRGSGGYGSTGK